MTQLKISAKLFKIKIVIFQVFRLLSPFLKIKWKLIIYKINTAINTVCIKIEHQLHLKVASLILSYNIFRKKYGLLFCESIINSRRRAFEYR